MNAEKEKASTATMRVKDVPSDVRGGIRALRHEFRTILGQILGYSELLEDQLVDLRALAPLEDVRRVKSAARKMLGLVDSAIDIEPGRAFEATPSSGAAAAESGARSRGSLLVVDDQEMNRDMLARRLEKRGFEVAVASSGPAALDLIGARAFDLVLLDIMMPGMSGLEVLTTLRKTHPAALLPVIMTTAKDASEDIVNAFELGANDYVTKPLDFQVVLARMETHLRLKRTVAEMNKMAVRLEMRNAFIRKAFGRYLTDDIVDDLLARPEGLSLGGEKRTVTILMSDLRGFSTLADELPPESVIILLNIFLGRMTDVLTGHAGTIDEFIGDSILAVFGAPLKRPDDADRALACAVDMQLAMEDVNRELRERGLPEVSMGIGIHTGEAIVGNVGSEKRAKYSVVGPTVVLASRIESYTMGGQILISAQTRDGLTRPVRTFASLRVHPKGSARPVLLYDVAGIEDGPFLPDAAGSVTPRALGEPIPFRYVLVEDKLCREEVRAGRLVQLGKNAALVRLENPVEELTDLKITLLGENGADRPGHVYARVIHQDPDRELVKVRFKSVDPGIRSFLDHLTDPPAKAGETGPSGR